MIALFIAIAFILSVICITLIMMLNPDEELLFDVHPMSYDEAFDGYLPNRKVGWQARFEKRGSVRPSDMINWYTLER